MRSYAIYGITVGTNFDLRWPLQSSTERCDVHFSCTYKPPTDLDIDASWPVHLVTADDPDSVDVAFHRFTDVDVIRFEGLMDHYLWHDRIVCHLHRPSLARLVEIQLLGVVLALWLERRAVPTLHASAAVIEGAAAAFLGTSGGGKTTIATALTAAGHPLLVDDLLALGHVNAQVVAYPGYPMLRLWPDQVHHFFGQHEELPRVHPAFAKRRVIVGEHLGRFHATPAPLRRIYLPTRSHTDELTIEHVASREALIATVRHSFLPEAVHAYGLAASRLRAFADLVGAVGVRRLRYPHGFDRLPELVAAIEHDLAQS